MCYARVRPDDIGRQFTRQKQQTHDVYSKVALEHLRIDFEKRPPPAPTALWISALGTPYKFRTFATASATWT